jgi:hypothetical protein
LLRVDWDCRGVVVVLVEEVGFVFGDVIGSEVRGVCQENAVGLWLAVVLDPDAFGDIRVGFQGRFEDSFGSGANEDDIAVGAKQQTREIAGLGGKKDAVDDGDSATGTGVRRMEEDVLRKNLMLLLFEVTGDGGGLA